MRPTRSWTYSAIGKRGPFARCVPAHSIVEIGERVRNRVSTAERRREGANLEIGPLSLTSSVQTPELFFPVHRRQMIGMDAVMPNLRTRPLEDDIARIGCAGFKSPCPFFR